MEDQIILDPNSRFAINLPEDSIASGNAYGQVLVKRRIREGFDLWETLPIICRHGGSMWLCRCCADNLLANGYSKCPNPKHKEQLKNLLRPTFSIVDGNPISVTTVTWSGMHTTEEMQEAMNELRDELLAAKPKGNSGACIGTASSNVMNELYPRPEIDVRRLK